MPPLVDRQMPAPVIGVARVDDIAVHVIALDLIGTRSRCRLQPWLIQPRTRLLIPLARKDRRAADLINQRPARDALGKGEFHRVIVERLGAQHPPLDRLGIGFQPLFEKEIVRKHHILRRHRRAICKPRLGPHMKDHPGLAGVIFEAFGQETIALVIAIPRQRLAGGLRAPEQTLINHPRQPPGAALARIGVHRIEGAGGIERDFAALRRVRVHIVEMRVIRRILEIAEIRITVRGDHLVLGQCRLRAEHGDRQSHPCRHSRPERSAA